MEELTAMVNIGREMARKLRSVGIDTPAQLAEAGAEAAFIRLRALYPNVCLVHLYALEGAILGIPFQAIPEARKRALRTLGGRTR